MKPTVRRAGALSIAALASLALGLGSTTGAASAADNGADGQRAVYRQLTKATAASRYVKLDLLALNDFHGNLETVPSTSSSGRINNTPAGGAAYLATKIRDERRKSRAAGATPITVAAGDLIGASPLLSAAFHDEPTIKAMNQIGLAGRLGRQPRVRRGLPRAAAHAARRLPRRRPDGANGQNSCPGGQGFDGRRLPVPQRQREVGRPGRHTRRDTLFPATKIMKVRGMKVGFIGMTLEGTPAIVSQAGIQGLQFTDEVETANALVPEAARQGRRSRSWCCCTRASPRPTPRRTTTAPVRPDRRSRSPRRLSPQIDAVVSGHTHQPYNCVVQDPAGRPAAADQRRRRSGG